MLLIYVKEVQTDILVNVVYIIHIFNRRDKPQHCYTHCCQSSLYVRPRIVVIYVYLVPIDTPPQLSTKLHKPATIIYLFIST
jgi:hypothetical protein